MRAIGSSNTTRIWFWSFGGSKILLRTWWKSSTALPKCTLAGTFVSNPRGLTAPVSPPWDPGYEFMFLDRSNVRITWRLINTQSAGPQAWSNWFSVGRPHPLCFRKVDVGRKSIASKRACGARTSGQKSQATLARSSGLKTHPALSSLGPMSVPIAPVINYHNQDEFIIILEVRYQNWGAHLGEGQFPGLPQLLSPYPLAYILLLTQSDPCFCPHIYFSAVGPHLPLIRTFKVTHVDNSG